MEGRYVLRLYVSGDTPRARTAADNIRQLCETEIPGRYELDVIDIQEQPRLADDDRVLATPTLIKALPKPLRRLIGDLSDLDKVLTGLDLPSRRT